MYSLIPVSHIISQKLISSPLICLIVFFCQRNSPALSGLLLRKYYVRPTVHSLLLIWFENLYYLTLSGWRYLAEMTELDKYLHFTLAFSFSFQWVNLHDCGVYPRPQGYCCFTAHIGPPITRSYSILTPMYTIFWDEMMGWAVWIAKILKWLSVKVFTDKPTNFWRRRFV